jgi:hypothetical protein
MKRLSVSLCIAAGLATVLQACSTGTSVEVATRVFEVPGDYTSFAWLPDGSVIASREGALWHLSADWRQAELLPLGDDPRCKRTRYLLPEILPDGRLGLIEWCINQYPEEPLGMGDERYLMAYDLDTGALAQLVDGPLPSSALSGAYTWNPSMTRGIQLASNGLVSTMYWLTPGGAEPMTMTVGEGKQAWSLDVDIATLLAEDRNDLGLVGLADWSPDGGLIAFWASPDAVGRDGHSRADAEWQLYLMTPSELVPQSVLIGIYDPHNLKWSPDGQWLAFYGESGIWRQQGLWLYSVATGELRLVAQGDYSERDMAWSLDGQAILSNRCCSPENPGTQFVIYQVEDFVTEKP